MNRRGLLGSAIALMSFASVSCENPSSEMKTFLKERQVGKHDLRVDGLVQLDWTHLDAERARKHDDWEAHEIPYPKFTADYFQYTVLRPRTEEPAFVLIQTGGIAGIFKVFGTKKISPPPPETKE